MHVLCIAPLFGRAVDHLLLLVRILLPDELLGGGAGGLREVLKLGIPRVRQGL